VIVSARTSSSLRLTPQARPQAHRRASPDETIKALPGVRITEVEDVLDVFSAKTRRQAGLDMTAPTVTPSSSAPAAKPPRRAAASQARTPLSDGRLRLAVSIHR
jgi:hypothetical protein